MNLREFRLLTDENIDPEVVSFLRGQGFDVRDVCESGLQGSIDVDLLQLAFNENRVVVTHDSDFGTLAILGGQSTVGIFYVRPGHINSAFTINTIQLVLDAKAEVQPPFILVAKRTVNTVTIRIRHLS